MPCLAIIVFWLSGALSVNLLGKLVFTENNPYIYIAYILAFPISYIFLLVSKIIGKIDYTDILKAVVIMTFSATFFDGIALTWFRKIYGNVFKQTHYGAAWILWAGGAGLLLGYIMSNKKKLNE